MKIRVINLITGVIVLFSPLSYAADLDISGYASFKAVSNVNDEGVSYYNQLAKTSHTNFDTRESNIGIQFATDISSRMDMTVVMSARGGPKSKYNFETEWAYANYKLNDALSFRVGKVKGPFYMVSDYKDVGYAYPWVSPPEEVYSTNPIRSVNGLDLIYQKTINNISYLGEVYFGSGTNTAFALPNAILGGALTGFGISASADNIGTQLDFETHNMLGFNASMTYEGFSFRAGYFNTLVDFGPYTNLKGSFGGIGLTVDVKNIVVYAEYIIRDTDPLLTAAFPDQTASYVTAGYRMGDFLPYATISKLDKGKDASNFAMLQESTAFGLRIEVDEAASLKFEAAYKKPGTYGLYDGPISGNGTIYTVALDLLF